jgi:hypothetical protein
MHVPGWTRADWEKEHMGAFQVGDQVQFDVVIGQKNTRLFGSVKDGRDGGRLLAVVSWMDAAGQKVIAEDSTAVKLNCTCWGNYDLKLNIPSAAASARHRLRLTYVNGGLKMNVSKDLFFDVTNDGGWKADPVIDAARAKYAAVLVLQNGRPCLELHLDRYDGAQDTYLLSTHSVPDRNSDFVNFGGLTYFWIGRYSLLNRALVKFDTKCIPAPAAVREAWLQLYSVTRRNGSPQIAAFEVLKDWSAGRGLGDLYVKNPVLPGEASWLCSQHPTRWDAPGCGGAGKDRCENPVGRAGRSKQAKGWVTIPLEPETVGRWVRRPESNRGLVLMDKNEATAEDSAQYRSCEFEDAVMRPRLIVALSEALPAGLSGCTSQSCPLPPVR